MSEVKPLLLEMPIRINGYDIDVMGIVSNIVYIRWFEDLRHHFLDVYWPYEEMLKLNQSPVLAKTEANYKYPLTIQDKPIIGKVWVHHFGRAKWEMGFEIANESRIFCTGTQMGYIFDINRKRPIPMPEELVERYKAEKKLITS